MGIKIKSKNKKSIDRFVNSLKLFGHGYSWGGFESLALHQEIKEQGQRKYLNLKKNNLYNKIWQAGAILLPVKSVGVMGDERTYERCVALRAVVSTDGMTADWYEFPNEFLKEISNNIINGRLAIE